MSRMNPSGGHSERVIDALTRDREETRAWRAWALPFVLFAVTSLLFSRWIQRPEPAYLADSTMASKLDQLRRSAADVDLLFIGSSRVYRGVIPQRFDELAAERGVATRSYNLGVPNLLGAEIEYVLDSLRPALDRQLRWLVIDVGGLKSKLSHDDHDISRVVNWHDRERLGRVFQIMRHEDAGRLDQLQYGARHLLSAAHRYARVGQGANRWSVLGGPPTAGELDHHLGARRDGYVALEDYRPDSERGERVALRRELFLAEVQDYRDDVARLAADRAGEPAPLRPHERAILAALVEYARDLGAEPIFVVAPRTGDDQRYLESALREGVIPVLFDYADPERFPELYAVERRYDSGHLSRVGAELWTAQLVDDLLPLLKDAAPR
jgi:hypothetical protein